MSDTIEALRKEIDECDREIVAAFVRRMNISRRIGEYKRERGLPVYDAAREERLYDKIEALGGEYGEYARKLYKSVTLLSRELQESEKK